MKRSVSLSLYAGALVISALVFSLGLLMGMQLTQGFAVSIQKDMERLKTESYVVELIASSQNASALCGFYEKQVERFGVGTGEIGKKLGFLESQGGSDAASLKEEYFAMELRDYLLLKKINSICGKKYVPVLYFLSSANCPSCWQQGQIVSQAKAAAPEKIMVYSFDVDSDSPAAEAAKSIYGVTAVPSLVVGETVLSGFQALDSVTAAVSKQT